MDIEPKLREMLVLKDPGKRFTDTVLAQIGEVPAGQSREGVVKIADAWASRRARRLLLGVLIVAGAAAATLPFLPGAQADRGGTLQPAGDRASPAGEASADATSMQTPASGILAGGDTLLDCIDPDVLHTLLLPMSSGQFQVSTSLPRELADFQAPRDLTWLGATERMTGPVATTSAVYRTGLAPAAARDVAGEGLRASGWTLQGNTRTQGSTVFLPATPVGETYCREGQQFTLMASALDGVTYVTLSRSRPDGAAGASSECAQPTGQAARSMSTLDDYMPSLDLPRDRNTGQPAAMSGHGGSGAPGDSRRRFTVSFSLNDSADSVARHFAGQMAAQGWVADTDWAGEATAGSTWIRQLDDGSTLLGMLAVSGFEDQRFTVVFRVLRTR